MAWNRHNVWVDNTAQEVNAAFLNDLENELLRLATAHINGVADLTNADVAAAANIARSKLDFGAGLTNADLAAAAGIALSKLAGYPGDATKFARGDGTWAVPSAALGQAPVVRAFRSTAKSIINNSNQFIDYDSININNIGASIVGGSIVLPLQGWYRVETQIAWSANSAGIRESLIALLDNAGAFVGFYGGNDVTAIPTFSLNQSAFATILTTTANQRVTADVFQNSGVALTLGTGLFGNDIKVIYLGST